MSNTSIEQEKFYASFRDFLIRHKASKKTITNYLADVRHFFRWLMESLTLTPSRAIHEVREETLENYKHSMVLAKTPAATINRRLSALRMFFQCAIANGWISVDPSHAIKNIPRTDTAKALLPQPESSSTERMIAPPMQDELADTIRAFMRDDRNNPDAKTTDEQDISEFLAWIAAQPGS